MRRWCSVFLAFVVLAAMPLHASAQWQSGGATTSDATLERAHEAYRQGRYGASVGLYSQVVDKQPEKELAWLGRAMARAARDWPQIQKSDPGIALQRSIEDDYLQALQLNPHVLEAYRAWPHSDEDLRDFAKKVEVMAAVHKTRGDAFMANNQIKEGLGSYDRAVALEPEDLFLRYTRGFMEQRLGSKEKAMADYDWMLARYRAEPNAKPTIPHLVLEQRAALFLERGDLPRALADLDEAIRLNAKYGPAYKLRAQVRQQMGDTVHAQADRDAAARLGSN